ncbi:MAG: CvpA family protein [Candidatus Promineifilaceae bacterium]
MISLFWLFWIMVGLFALVGTLRGWSKEVIAMAGLILSLFTIKQFGWPIVRLVSGQNAVLTEAMKQQFVVLASIHLVIAFFSYQGVYLVRNRLSGRERLQERLLGMGVGAVNGYFLVGALWSFLEYQATPEGFIQLPPGVLYAFDPFIIRPASITPFNEILLAHLPLPWLGPYLPILVVIIFLFVIIAVI